ncbi:MAG: hypothetical protein Q4D31_02165 [Eubacteriales bacterium]|nr:hypothetical protein [Eubacteriales bacterium]
MDRQDRRALAAALTACAVLIAGATMPPPRAGWWCTAFSVVCSEAGQTGQSAQAAPAMRWLLADWLRGLAG